MIETVYKTATPEKDKSECYVLVLTSRASSGGSLYAFMEHGQWNNDLKRLLYKVRSINTDERLTYQHARGLYEMSKRPLAQMGFVHCFASDGRRKELGSDEAPKLEAAIG